MRGLPGDIAELLARPAADLTRDELLEVAADACGRSSWDISGRRDHIEAICRLLVERVEPQLRELEEREAAIRQLVRGAEPALRQIAEGIRQLTGR